MSMWRGLSAFPITPARADGTVIEAELANLVDRLCDAEVDSIGLLGSTGTYAYLSHSARNRAVAVALEAVQGRVPLIVSVGAMRTDAAIALARTATAAGADGLLLAPVSYTPLTQTEVAMHFSAVAAATDLPLCIYNNPTTTHFLFGEALLTELAKSPNIAAVKMPLPADADFTAELARLRPQVPADFSIGYSGDWGCTEALIAGGDAWFSAVGGLIIAPIRDIARAITRGDHETARKLDATLAPIWELCRENGSLRVIYAAARLMGLTSAELPRPLLPLGAAKQAQLDAALSKLGQ